MNDKEKVSAILSVLLTAAIALLAVFGYHVVIVQPQIAGLVAGEAGVVETVIRAESGVEVVVGGSGVITVVPASDSGK